MMKTTNEEAESRISSFNIIQFDKLRKLMSLGWEVNWIGTHDLISDSIEMSAFYRGR